MKKAKLDKEEVKHISKLAGLELSSDEVIKFQKQLSDILDYIKILKRIETKDVKPTSQVTGLENVSRKDDLTDSLSQDEALSGTANKNKGMFKVKAIF